MDRCGQVWMGVDGCGWVQMGVDGCGWVWTGAALGQVEDLVMCETHCAVQLEELDRTV